MPPIGPIKRKDLIYFLRQVGFDGPFSGGKHQFMQRGNLIVRIPNPHQADIGTSLLVRILKQASINKETWEKL
jgi:predicted RNA binding protein YcfA (HicA-like mRNA interferase family)